MSLAECLVAGLELGSIVNHLLNLGGTELSDSVADGDVGTAAGGLLSGSDLENTVDVDLEDDLENGLTSPHGWDGCECEFSERGVVLAVGAFTLAVGVLIVFENRKEESSLTTQGTGQWFDYDDVSEVNEVRKDQKTHPSETVVKVLSVVR